MVTNPDAALTCFTLLNFTLFNNVYRNSDSIAFNGVHRQNNFFFAIFRCWGKYEFIWIADDNNTFECRYLKKENKKNLPLFLMFLFPGNIPVRSFLT